MGLILTPSAAAVTIGGVGYPLAVISSAGARLAPEVDTLAIEIPWGARRISGSADPAETLPALGAAVVATCGAWTWRGLLTRRTRSAAGGRRFLSLTAHGPGLALDRAYLPSFARDGITGIVQTPGGPRFSYGTCSSTTGGPDSTHTLTSGGGAWTVAKALAAYVAHATAYAGLPAITIDPGDADLTRNLADTDTDGLSVHAGLQAILGYRLGLTWRIQITETGWVLRVRSLSGTGAAVDLTTGGVGGYEVSEDASAALADLEVRGARKVYVFSIDGKTTGDLTSDWSGGDETARAAGDRSSPAFRRFRLASFSLPDGSSSLTADLVPTLPIQESTSLLAGSAPWLLFAQLTADSTWISLQGRVSISVSGRAIWIEGIDPDEWATWSRLRLTLAMSPRAHLTATHTGGSGLGRGLAIVGTRHAYASAAATRLSGASLATVQGTVINEQSPIDDEAAALWDDLGGPQLIASWTRVGVAGGGPEPGDRITSLILPVPGSTATTVPCDCLCTGYVVRWSGDYPTTTWEAGPVPFSPGALAR